MLRRTLDNNGLAVTTATHENAVVFAQEYAAEHVSIATAFPDADASRITAAGSVTSPCARVGRDTPREPITFSRPVDGRRCTPQIDDLGSGGRSTLTRHGPSDLSHHHGDRRPEGLTAHSLAAPSFDMEVGRRHESDRNRRTHNK